MKRQGGFTYLFLLFTIAIVSVGLVGAASVHHYTERRQAEAELLRIGREFQAALASYRAVGSTREFPLTLDELLEDERGGVLHRHLRKIHRDPVTREAEWGLVRIGGRIVGVHSLSTARPIKVAGFHPGEEHLENARSYEEWRFMVVPDQPGLLPGAPQRPGHL